MVNRVLTLCFNAIYWCGVRIFVSQIMISSTQKKPCMTAVSRVARDHKKWARKRKLVAVQFWWFLRLSVLLNGLDASRWLFGKKRSLVLWKLLWWVFLNDKQFLKELTFLSNFSFWEVQEANRVQLTTINKVAVDVGIANYQMIHAFLEGTKDTAST